ncbi:MAG: hypothetical protein PVI86_05500 [Phycisphaerae bacterium]
MFTVNKNPTSDDLRKFGYAMLGGFAVIGMLLYFVPWIKSRDASAIEWTGTLLQWIAVCLPPLGVMLCALSLLAPAAAKPVYVVWMTVGAAVGAVVSTVMLTVLFVFLLPVFSVIVRFSDPLRKRLKSDGTYWEDYKPHEPTIERMKRPF